MLEVATMAVYEFECQACHERFEVSAPMTAHDRLKEQPPACPKCGQRQSRQLTSLFSCKPPDKY
jgi:putative FmdB family regulatory protein